MVLLVDDQPIIAEALRRRIADDSDICMEYCRNPADAIRTVGQVAPTVVLLDIVMPGIDGMTLCRSLRTAEATRSLPVVMLSSTEDPRVKAEAFAAGANDYLIKLPDTLELKARLRYHSQAYRTQCDLIDALRSLHDSQRQLESLNAELLQLAHRDGLTGLFNRRYFDDRFLDEWRRAARGQHPLSLIMIDVDHFKAYNDHYGHLAGDDCLKQIAAILLGCARRSSDVVARYGGEEFVALLPETPSAGAVSIAERLLRNIDELCIPHAVAGNNVTISLGVATAIPGPHLAPSALVSGADQSLYESKRCGRHRITTGIVELGRTEPGS